MQLTRHTSHVIALGAISALLFIPNISLLYRADDSKFAAAAFVQSLFLWILVLCALGRWRLVLWASLPILLTVPLESFFIYIYGYPTTRHVVALLYETTSGEALEYLSGLWHVLAASFAALITAWLRLFAKYEDFKFVGRRTQLSAIFSLALLSVGLDLLRGVESMPDRIRQYTWANTFPTGIAFRVAGFAREQSQLSSARAAIAGHRWNSRTDTERIDLILVIGESSRPDHWGIGGYTRDTTPRLSRRQGVVFLPDLVTPWTLTRYSAPALLKRKRPADGGVITEKSIIAAFREAGFETHWLANQDGLGELSIHAAEAEFRSIYNFATSRGDIDAPFDGTMLADVASALSRPSPRKFLVMHTKGSHWEYQLRYPPEFIQYSPDRTATVSGGKYDPRSRASLVNAYDNSILYTDHILDSLISMLAARKAPSAVVYVSDHGQGLYDDGCDIFGHGNDLEAAFRTAGLIWLSPNFVDSHREAAENLAVNSQRKLLTSLMVFNTVADIGGLNIADNQRSLLKTTMLQEARMVNTNRGLVDFDKSAREGKCRLIAPQKSQ